MTLEAYEEFLKRMCHDLNEYVETGWFGHVPTYKEIPLSWELADVLRKVGDRVYRERSNDALTNLWHRQIVFSVIESALATPNLYDRPTCVAFVDIDRMKWFNDHASLPDGDRLIIQIADYLKTAFHPQHWVARVGGDEFMIVLSTGIDNAAETIHKFHNNLQNAGFSFQYFRQEDYNYKPSVRISVTEIRQDDTYEQLLYRLEAAIHNERNIIKVV
jgi:diguanylate cyclase (GGDEF)-like protein